MPEPSQGSASRPGPAWLAPYAATLARLQAHRAGGLSAAQALQRERDAHAGPGALPGFVDARALPPDEAYEAFVHRSSQVPTRDNLHDLFNGLVWLHLPATKGRLNLLQAGEIARSGIGRERGRLRDALTLFDENGAVLQAPPVLWRALVARDWQTLFVHERAAWREARLWIVGHALLEKLEAPRKPHTAHVLCAPGHDPSIDGDDDEAIARALAPAHLSGKPFVPLPVLGVPGWWPGNEDPGFYDDAAVFRLRRAPGSAGD